MLPDFLDIFVWYTSPVAPSLFCFICQVKQGCRNRQEEDIESVIKEYEGYSTGQGCGTRQYEIQTTMTTKGKGGQQKGQKKISEENQDIDTITAKN